MSLAHRAQLPRPVIVAWVAALLLLVATGAVSWHVVRSLDRASAWVVHTQEVLATLEMVRATANRAESAQRAYLLTRAPARLTAMAAATTAAESHLATLRRLLADSPQQAGRVATLAQAFAERTRLLERIIAIRDHDGIAAAVDQFGRGEQAMLAVQAGIDALAEHERELLRRRSGELEATRRWTGAALGATTLLALLVGVAAGWLALREVARRRAIEVGLRTGEARFRSVVVSAPDAIVITDDEGLVRDWNPAAETMFGWRREEMLGRAVTLAMPEDLRGRWLDQLRRWAAGEPPPATAALHGQRRDGAIFPIEVAMATWDVAGRHWFSAFIRDVTAREQARGDLVRARDEAEDAARAKADFLATMSHEIRTPMNGVIGMSGLLLDTPLGVEQRGYAEAIRGSAEHLLAIINDILDFSKIEAGRLDLEHLPYAPRPVVEDAVALLAEQAQAKGLELTCVIEPTVPERLVGDAGRLRQVVINLVSNAVRFTSEGEVAVTVGWGEGRLVVAVRDTGIGIPAEQQARLFQPFVQADASTTRRFGGTGLGLAISRRLVALMGGGISVDSEPGVGSTFRFDIAAEAVPDDVVGDVPELRGLRVLVVDDNATSRAALAQELAAWGMVPVQAADGAAAVALAGGGEPFALVIVDHGMPGMDGASCARALRAAPMTADAPAILLVSHAARARSAALREATGAAAVLAKPARQSLLHDCIAELLAGRPAVQPPSPAASPGPDPALAGRRVLVAEDNIVNLRVAVRLLEKLGCRVDTAANGIEAVSAQQRIGYDLILMDCQMPELDGYAATREIRRREGAVRVPIIAMTANALAGDRERCLAAGMDDHIAKPVVAELLRETLRQWLGAPPMRADGCADDGPVLDGSALANLREEVGDAVVAEVVAVFRQQTPALVAEFRAAAAARDGDAMARIAHRMKGSALTIGLRGLAAQADRAESAARAGDISAATMADALEECLRRSLAALDP